MTDPETDYEDGRNQFERFYFGLISEAEDKLETYGQVNPVQGLENNLTYVLEPSVQNTVKLPTISIVKFDGNYQNWASFKDSFKALIDDNGSLTNIQKFLYLNGCLSGMAAELLEALEISDENNLVAWSLLEEKFENKRVIILNILKG